MRRTIFATLAVLAIALTTESAEPAKFEISATKRVSKAVPVTVFDAAAGVNRTILEMRVEAITIRSVIDPARTAVVVCDMWDDHWCKKAAERCGELAKAAEPVLKACRDRGMTIIHCPSDTMAFYKDHPARKRMFAVRKIEPPKSREMPDPRLPVDDSDGGCDDEKPVKSFKAWSRQHAAITIDGDKDYITDAGVEVYSLMDEKGIDTLFVMGVHTNMCVLNRTFAIKQMVKWGKTVYLVRDLTDAMYNPKMNPKVSHQRGTELIIEHIEQHWCPTIDSKQLAPK
jgi:nicotinamidase-related amidase